MSNKSKGKEKTSDPAWDHCSKINENRLNLKCKHCGKNYWGGITRMKHHLGGTHSDVAQCEKCPVEVREIFQKLAMKKKHNDDENSGDEIEIIESGGGKKRKLSIEAYVKKGLKNPSQKTTLNTIFKKKEREELCLDICRCIYANALPFNLVKDHYFKIMLKSVGEFGQGLKPPSYHEARVSFLKKEVAIINGDMMEKYKAEWKKTGCTLMSDGWTDGKYRSITNFLVNSPRGTVFLRSIDTSSIHKSADNLFELLDSLVEEIGEENVVQVVTDSASAYVKAGELLMAKRKQLFWSPCAAHCLDLILTDIGDMTIHHDTVSKARTITVYIYRHTWVLNLMRKYTKGRDLTRAGVTRFASCYLTLRRLQESKIAIRSMFGSEEWQKSQYAKKGDGVKVRNTVLSDENFWKAITYCLKGVVPLVKVLRLVDGDVKPAMGYIYEAMDKAKEQIAKKFANVQKRYKPIWDIIDTRWDMQLHRPLHAAGYFLNPRFQYSSEFNADFEIRMGLYQTIERMCPSPIVREKIDKQIETFKEAQSMFGIDMAKQMRNKKQPALWWESYGGGCKELQNLAVRILSLTCSATGCERNWSTFDQVHSKRRNRLEQKRLDALVFVKYNRRLEARHEKRIIEGESYDPISLSDMESDDEWITEKEDPLLPDDTTWMDVNDEDCFQVEEGESSKKRKRGPRNLSFNKKAKDKQVVDKDSEDEEIQEIEEVHSRNDSEDLVCDDEDDDDDAIDIED